MTPAHPQLVQCPNCQRTLPYTHLNPHLDRCLSSDAQSQTHSQGSGTGSSSGNHGNTNTNNNNNNSGNSNTRSNDVARPPNHSFSPSTTTTPLKGKLPSASKRASPPPIESQHHPPSHAPAAAKRPKIEPDADRPFAPLPTTQPPKQPRARSRLDAVKPFAERMRPQTLDDFVGQDQVINGPLKMLLRQGRIPSMILWGPPGTGKTTLARLLAKPTVTSAASASKQRATPPPPPYRFIEISATTAGTAEVKKIIDEALPHLQLTGQATLLFIDEIQRFSRAQQDVFLPAVEKGQIVLVAATTENPSFRLQGALLSRMRVFVLNKLSVDECCTVIQKAIERVKVDEEQSHHDGDGDGDGIKAVLSHIDADLIRWIANVADGDARTALGALELALTTTDVMLSSSVNVDKLKAALSRSHLLYDRTGSEHYDCISALHKSIRGSDANAALYWLARMVCSGDDALFIARRLIVAASEDIDTLEALQMATATYTACQVVGLPECAENLAQCVVFLAESSKSTRSYRAWKKVKSYVEGQYNYPVPFHIRNAPTKMGKEMGFGRAYRYEPRFAHPVYQEFLPEEMKGTRFLSPPPPAVDPTGRSCLMDREEKENMDQHLEHPMTKDKGIGPGSCQRQFQIGARIVDWDMLEEWEMERNDGKPWSGRKQLEETLQRLQSEDEER